MTTTTYSEKCSVYPGEYIPKLGLEEVARELDMAQQQPVSEPLINIIEHPDHFKIEASIPGVKREDFYIQVADNILSITVIHKGYPEREKGNYQLHEFDTACFHRHFVLPENVDADFARAEYKGGVLQMHLPKNGGSRKLLPLRIVVY